MQQADILRRRAANEVDWEYVGRGDVGEIRITWRNDAKAVEFDFVDPPDNNGIDTSSYYYRSKARCEAAPKTLREMRASGQAKG